MLAECDLLVKIISRGSLSTDLRKTILGVSLLRSFYTAWVINGPSGLEIRLPFYHRDRTSPSMPAISVSCHICLTGKSAKTCPATFAKIFLFFRNANQAI